jgi:hypothetical protein
MEMVKVVEVLSSSAAATAEAAAEAAVRLPFAVSSFKFAVRHTMPFLSCSQASKQSKQHTARGEAGGGANLQMRPLYGTNGKNKKIDELF